MCACVYILSSLSRYLPCDYCFLTSVCIISSAEDNLAKAQATYGTGSCFLLRINSRHPHSAVHGENPWSPVARHSATVNSAAEVCMRTVQWYTCISLGVGCWVFYLCRIYMYMYLNHTCTVCCIAVMKAHAGTSTRK